MISKWCSIHRYWLFDSVSRVHDLIYSIILLKIPFSSVDIWCSVCLPFSLQFLIFIWHNYKISWKRMKISILFEILQLWKYPCFDPSAGPYYFVEGPQKCHIHFSQSIFVSTLSFTWNAFILKRQHLLLYFFHIFMTDYLS